MLIEEEAVLQLDSPAGMRRALPDLPAEVYLEVTNRCNLRCRTCPQFTGMAESAADLSLAQVRHIVDQLPAVRRAVLHGIGEPSLNKELPAIISYLKARGAFVLFNSNGLALSDQRMRRIVDAAPDEIRISLDAATRATYMAVRGVDGLPRILRNLRALVAYRTGRGAETPALSCWMTLLRENVAEVPALVRLAHNAEIDEVYIQRLVFTGGALATSEHSLFGAADEDELAVLTEAEDLARRLGVRLRGSDEAQPTEHVARGGEGPAYQRCLRPWRLVYVTAQGNVLPCCIAPFAARRYENIVLGNAFAQPLTAIWHGERYAAWRDGIEAGRPLDPCSRCGLEWSL
jgi:MoaA/NifB/PqqE/SkfB family radical SAM enzyme